jgi:hypothetical protein
MDHKVLQATKDHLEMLVDLVIQDYKDSRVNQVKMG